MIFTGGYISPGNHHEGLCKIIYLT